MKTASYWFGHLQQISKWRVPCREERKNTVASERRPRHCLQMDDISCAHIILNTGLQSLEAVNINIKLSVTFRFSLSFLLYLLLILLALFLSWAELFPSLRLYLPFSLLYSLRVGTRHLYLIFLLSSSSYFALRTASSAERSYSTHKVISRYQKSPI